MNPRHHIFKTTQATSDDISDRIIHRYSAIVTKDGKYIQYDAGNFDALAHTIVKTYTTILEKIPDVTVLSFSLQYTFDAPYATLHGPQRDILAQELNTEEKKEFLRKIAITYLMRKTL